MATWYVNGGNRLEGTYRVQGSKNASLPILAATVLSPCITELTNVPELTDTDTALIIIKSLGCTAEKNGGNVIVDSRGLSNSAIPCKLMREMRSSIIFLGALIARCGEASACIPGGCKLGKRPIDIHLSAMRRMGVDIEEIGDKIICKTDRITGAHIELPFPSVGATENIMLLACRAAGETVIDNCAKEPEISALQEHLRAMGAIISGAGTDRIVISGFRPAEHICTEIIPDRIAAATVMCAAAAAGGDVELSGAIEQHISYIEYFLKRVGCDIINRQNAIRIKSPEKLLPAGDIITGPYPMFPTDAQPLIMAALLKADGRSSVEENIFENRFRHVAELHKLGADITISGKTAVISGKDKLVGTKVTATDLRGGAALIIAGLSAEGETVIFDSGHIERGYERLDLALSALGANIFAEY